MHWDNPDPAWNYGTDVSIDYVPKDPVAYLVYPSAKPRPATLGEWVCPMVSGQ